MGLWPRDGVRREGHTGQRHAVVEGGHKIEDGLGVCSTVSNPSEPMCAVVGVGCHPSAFVSMEGSCYETQSVAATSKCNANVNPATRQNRKSESGGTKR